MQCMKALSSSVLVILHIPLSKMANKGELSNYTCNINEGLDGRSGIHYSLKI